MKKIIFKSSTAIVAIFLGLVIPAKAQWTTSGTNIRNSNTGNVGINTSTATPSKRLHVHSATSRDQVYISGTTPSIFLGENVSIAAANNKMGTLSMTTESNMFAFGTASGDLVMSSRTGKLHFITGASNASSGKIRMSVGTDRVTIGTSADAFGLEVLGTNSNCLKLMTGTDALLINPTQIESNKPLSINGSSGKDIIMCAFSGNVGIGKSNPQERLDIMGNIKAGDNGLNTITLGGQKIESSSNLLINSLSQKNVGIGTDSPTSKLEINGMDNNGTNAALKITTAGTSQTMLLDGNEIDALSGGLYLNTNSNLKVIMCENGGSVGIGTATPSSNYKLSVNGAIRAKEVTVQTDWSDFVFEKGYDLKSLKAIEEFINKNGHLPEIPNAKEVAENGIKVGEIQSKLLMKIEELTLYLIKQEKRIADLETNGHTR